MLFNFYNNPIPSSITRVLPCFTADETDNNKVAEEPNPSEDTQKPVPKTTRPQGRSVSHEEC